MKNFINQNIFPDMYYPDSNTVTHIYNIDMKNEVSREKGIKYIISRLKWYESQHNKINQTVIIDLRGQYVSLKNIDFIRNKIEAIIKVYDLKIIF